MFCSVFRSGLLQWRDLDISTTLFYSVLFSGLVCYNGVTLIFLPYCSVLFLGLVYYNGMTLVKLGSVGSVVYHIVLICSVFRSGLLQWGDLGSVVLAAFLLLSNKISTIQHVFISTAVLGVCPGIRMTTLVSSLMGYLVVLLWGQIGNPIGFGYVN